MPLLGIVLHGIRPCAVCAVVVHERGLDVQEVDHGRRDGDDPPIDGRRRPRRPAALGRARDHEPCDLLAAAFRSRRELGDRVHGAHRALGHGQARRPFLVAGAQELVPGVGDEIILGAWLLRGIVHEHDGLIGHQAQFRGDGAGIPRRADEPCRRARRGLTLEAAAGDEEQRHVARHLLGTDDGQPVRPQGTLHLGLGQPLLRGHFQQRGRDAFRRERFQDLPGETGIRRRDISVERRLCSGARLRLLSVPREDGGGRQERDQNSVAGERHGRGDYSRR